MITLPQFFRHFVPKIATAFSSGSRGKAAKYSSSSERSDRIQSPKVPYRPSTYGEVDIYVELGERDMQSKAFDPVKPGTRVWSDEVSASDEEKGLRPAADDEVVRAPHW